MLKIEESLNEENHQIINEELEVNPIDQKLIQMETSKNQKLIISISIIIPIWDSNTLKIKKIKQE